MFALSVVLLALGCSGGCGGKAVSTPEIAAKEAVTVDPAAAAAAACDGQIDHLDKRLRATLAAAETAYDWNGWEPATGLWTAVADTPKLDAPRVELSMWVTLSVSAAGLIGVEGEAMPAPSDRTGFCRSVTTAIKKRAIAGTSPSVLVRPHGQASGKAVATTLRTLHGCGVDAPMLVFSRATPPNVVLEPPPPKAAEAVAALRASGKRADIFPSAVDFGALGDLYGACEIDRRSIAQARRTERAGVLAAALLDGFRACRCATDPDVMAWNLQAVTLPDTFATLLPVALAPTHAAVPVEPGDDWNAVIARIGAQAAAAPKPVAIWFADVPAGGAGAWTPGAK